MRMLMVAALLLASCASARVSPECRDEVNRCVDACPPDIVRDKTVPASFSDPRSNCLMQCQGKARGCESRVESRRSDAQSAKNAFE